MATKRRNFDETLAALKAKRRAGTITRQERRELDALEIRWRSLVEWVAEPVDEHGDIVDPLFSRTDAEAGLDAARALVDFRQARYVDVARVTSKGSDADGMTYRDYDYRYRLYPDGRRVELRTSPIGEPVEVGT